MDETIIDDQDPLVQFVGMWFHTGGDIADCYKGTNGFPSSNGGAAFLTFNGNAPVSDH